MTRAGNTFDKDEEKIRSFSGVPSILQFFKQKSLLSPKCKEGRERDLKCTQFSL